MVSLLKRNCLLYFRNKSGVFSSLLGALISFILYIVFLQKNLSSSFEHLSQHKILLDNWLMSGTLAITGITTTLASFSQMASDRENKVDQDLFMTDLGTWRLPLSYFLSASIIGFFMQLFIFIVMMIYFACSDGVVFYGDRFPALLGIMVLSSLLASFLNGLLLLPIKSVDSLGRIATIVGTASGFLVGTYMPIGILPDGAQFVMKLTPATYIASLYRQLLMEPSLDEVFSGQEQAREQFEKLMGVRLDWNQLLTSQETWIIVVILLISVGCLWGISQKIYYSKIGIKVF